MNKYQELEAKVVEMQAEIERLKSEETKPVELRKRVERLDTFYYLNVGGDIRAAVDHRASLDRSRFERGNYYITQQAAGDDRPYVNLMLKLRHLARDLNDGWVPDWTDSSQVKVYLTIGYNDVGPHTASNYYYRIPGVLYFKTEELAQAALDSLSDDELELIRRWR